MCIPRRGERERYEQRYIPQDLHHVRRKTEEQAELVSCWMHLEVSEGGGGGHTAHLNKSFLLVETRLCTLLADLMICFALAALRVRQRSDLYRQLRVRRGIQLDGSTPGRRLRNRPVRRNGMLRSW